MVNSTHFETKKRTQKYKNRKIGWNEFAYKHISKLLEIRTHNAMIP